LSSRPTSTEPERRLSPRRSAIWRLTAVYAAAFTGCALMFVAGAFHLVRMKNVERVEALVAADLEAVLDKVGQGPPDITVGKATAIVLARSGRAADPRFYAIERDGRPVAGGLTADARLTPRDDRWLKVYEPSAPPGLRRGLAVRAPLGPGQSLLVGRAFEDRALETELLRVGVAALALAALAAFVVGPWASRRILRRVNEVNDACDKVRSGDLSARAPGEETQDEFGALAGHVNAMLERIDGLIMGLRDVSNRVAHDLRTPMARLKSDLEGVARARTLKEARQRAGAAAAETDEILQTFEALLDIAEAEAGSDGGLRPMQLEDAVQSAVDLYEAVAEDRDVGLVFVRRAAPMLGERSLVMRLAANLIDNAIKFSPRGSTVRVETAVDGDEAVLSVQDRGPGVPEGERESVMRRFTRGSAAAAAPGHGLGLALVAAVAKRHGAKIRLDDAGPGLIVRVRFRTFSG
jgi:signal transduction histidine kinase